MPYQSKYDNSEFTLATGQTDYNVKTGQSSSFDNVKVYKRTEIRTDQTITFKLNTTSSPSITLNPEESPYTINWSEVTNVFITNSSGSTASIKILGTE